MIEIRFNDKVIEVNGYRVDIEQVDPRPTVVGRDTPTTLHGWFKVDEGDWHDLVIPESEERVRIHASGQIDHLTTMARENILTETTESDTV